MAEITTGLRSVLSAASAYTLTQRALGSRRGDALFLAEHAHPEEGESVLDLGCGTAEILRAMPRTRYVGVDRHEPYLEAARRRFAAGPEFICGDASDLTFDLGRRFDLVLVIALLHHLDDDQAVRVFANAARHVNEDGRLVALDCAIEPHQSRIARWLIQHDRGQNVRSARGYRDLAEGWFGSVSVSVREDLLRVPYTHAVLECRQPRGGPYSPPARVAGRSRS